MRRVLKLLETPYAEEHELSQAFTGPPLARAEDSFVGLATACSNDPTCDEDVVRRVRDLNVYTCKPPSWAMDLRVT